jgi:hypothetical protein
VVGRNRNACQQRAISTTSGPVSTRTSLSLAGIPIPDGEIAREATGVVQDASLQLLLDRSRGIQLRTR